MRRISSFIDMNTQEIRVTKITLVFNDKQNNFQNKIKQIQIYLIIDSIFVQRMLLISCSCIPPISSSIIFILPLKKLRISI